LTVAISTILDGTSGGTLFTATNGALAALGTDETQQIAITGSSGAFTLTFNGQTTTPLAFNASAVL
jgi:hypothetical protein